MRATVMYGAGDVRVEQVPDATVRQPTDAVVRVVRSARHGGRYGLNGVDGGQGEAVGVPQAQDVIADRAAEGVDGSGS